MADTAVSFALDQVLQLLREETNLLIGVHKDFVDIKEELESIHPFLKDADRRAADVADTTNEGVRTWVKQLIQASFRIEDVVDEYRYLIHVTTHPGRGALLSWVRSQIGTLAHRKQIASEIQDVKMSIHGIKERSERYSFQITHEQGSSSSSARRAEDRSWHDLPRFSSFLIEETEIVGFESPRNELVHWLLEGESERTVISVVGMGGLGKTTIANHVFGCQAVKGVFDFRALITVPQSYTTKGLLIDMMEQFCKDTKDPLPEMLHKMDVTPLITQVREYLQQKKYLIYFDNIWQVDFSDQVQLALPNNNKGSRIIITTRMMEVAEFFKKSFLVHVHNLQPLPPNKAWELFCRKTFRFGDCPAELENMSRQLVQKCHGLPLAIVTIGGLLSSKPKTIFEWYSVVHILSMKFERNSHLTSLFPILSLSYNDLPYYLKPCLLYFGTYPEDYCISRARLIRQWIAEGFVKYEEKRTLEQVAEEYLTELVHRSLVQVSKVGYGGKIKSCQIHDLLRDLIIIKMQDSSFCHLLHVDGEAVVGENTRRLSIPATCSNDVLRSIAHSRRIRAIYAFEESDSSHPFTGEFFEKSKFLKLLDFEGTSFNYVPRWLGNLFHLRYLNLRKTKVKVLPKSIGNLYSLETLDLRETLVRELPIEINKLTKLRHLCAYSRNYEASYTILGFTTGVFVQKGIGCLTSLQNLYFLEVDDNGLDLIQELKKLRQLRRLGLRRVRREHGYGLCASLQEMKHLESLNITAVAEDEMISLNLVSFPTQLRCLHLKARLDKLPDWIPKLEYLVKLRLALSMLIEDPLKLLKSLPSLLWLAILENAYDGATLHFEQGGFVKLKELFLAHLNKVDTIIIEKGALPVLEELKFDNIPCLKEVPSGIKHLENLKLLDFANMPDEFIESIDPEGGQHYCIIKHVPIGFVRRKVGPKFHDFDIRPIHLSQKNKGSAFSMDCKGIPSSSSSQVISKYDVFVSFRGEDTRSNFTDHLFAALHGKGFVIFKDDTKLRKGESISTEVLQAIEKSQILIVVFSKNYASSTWCLQELVNIADCIDMSGQTVLPIFNDVNPSEVQTQSGDFGKAFIEHEERFKDNSEMVQRWREAISQVASLSGWDLSNNPQDGEKIGKIIKEVARLLGNKLSTPPDDLVGMQSRVEELENLLILDSNDDVRVVGVCGMGGVGKSTLAAILYDRIFDQFDAGCFIDDVSKRFGDHGPIEVQKQILSQILNEENLQLYNPITGTNLLRTGLRHKKTLIVLDNVEEVQQLDKLTIKREWLGAGSRIIILSRYRHILREYDVNEVYEAQLLNDHDARQLFRRKAFKCDDIQRDYVHFESDVLEYAKGLPLAIRVLGSLLFGRDVSEWRNALDRLKKNSKNDIMDVLRISFDALMDIEKEIFLDICCFFHEHSREYVEHLLDIRGFCPQVGITVLIEKLLVTINRHGHIAMHDLLKELGRNIVREKSPKEPRKWSRLWDYNDFHNVMEENMAAENLEVIFVERFEVDSSKTMRVDTFSKMIRLKLLLLPYVNLNFSGSLSYLSSELRYLRWINYPFQYLPPSFKPDNLVELVLRRSSIKQLWKDSKPLHHLRKMDLSHSKNLIKMPDFRDMPNLESLRLEGCIRLVQIDPSIGILTKLDCLDLRNCINLVSIPDSIFCLSSLKDLSLTGCSKLYKNRLLGKPRHAKNVEINETSINSSQHQAPSSKLQSSLFIFYIREGVKSQLV